MIDYQYQQQHRSDDDVEEYKIDQILSPGAKNLIITCNIPI